MPVLPSEPSWPVIGWNLPFTYLWMDHRGSVLLCNNFYALRLNISTFKLLLRQKSLNTKLEAISEFRPGTKILQERPVWQAKCLVLLLYGYDKYKGLAVHSPLQRTQSLSMSVKAFILKRVIRQRMCLLSLLESQKAARVYFLAHRHEDLAKNTEKKKVVRRCQMFSSFVRRWKHVLKNIYVFFY